MSPVPPHGATLPFEPLSHLILLLNLPQLASIQLDNGGELATSAVELTYRGSAERHQTHGRTSILAFG